MAGSMFANNPGISQPQEQTTDLSTTTGNQATPDRSSYQEERGSAESRSSLIAGGLGSALWDKAKKAGGNLVNGVAQGAGEAVGNVAGAGDVGRFIKDAKEHFSRGRKTHDEVYPYGLSGITKDSAEGAVTEIQNRLRFLGKGSKNYTEYAVDVMSISERIKNGAPFEDKDCVRMLEMLKDLRERSPIASFMTPKISSDIVERLQGLIDKEEKTKKGGLTPRMEALQERLNAYKELSEPTLKQQLALLNEFSSFKDSKMGDALDADQKKSALQEVDARLDMIKKSRPEKEWKALAEELVDLRKDISDPVKDDQAMTRLVEILGDLQYRTEPRALLGKGRQEDVFNQLREHITAFEGDDTKAREISNKDRQALYASVGADAMDPKFPEKGISLDQEMDLMKLSMRIHARDLGAATDSSGAH